MPGGDFAAIQPPGCLRHGAIVLLLAGVLAVVAAFFLGCGSTRRPEPIPTPGPLPAVVTDYVPVYDACPPAPDLAPPLTWQLVVDGILSPELGVKLMALEFAFRSLVDYSVDLEVMLQPYRVPPPTPTPRPR